jgi:hypothetical protein
MNQPAIIAVFLAIHGLAAAQTPTLQCFEVPANNVTMRGSSIAEPIGDQFMFCTGTPTTAGQAVAAYDITMTLDATVTNRRLAGDWADALLLIDSDTATRPLICGAAEAPETSPGVCQVFGTGDGQGVYDGSQGRPNVFQAQLGAGGNILVWHGVPLDGGTHNLRFTNVRVVTPIVMGGGWNFHAYLTTNPVIPISSPFQLVGVAFPAFGFSTASAPEIPTCSGANTALLTDPSASGVAQTQLTFGEFIPFGFRRRSAAVFVDNDLSPPPISSSEWQSETGYVNLEFPAISGRGDLAKAGLADSGTRLYARFYNVPAGMHLFAPTVVPLTGDQTHPGVLRMVASSLVEGGPFEPVPAQPNGLAEIATRAGLPTLVYEVLDSSPNAGEQAHVPLYLAYYPGALLVPTGAAWVHAGFAPLSTVVASSETAPVPRFLDLQSPGSLFTVTGCNGTTVIDTLPSGLGIVVDGVPHTAPQSFEWEIGSQHSIGAVSVQPGAAATRYVLQSWSDGIAAAHDVLVEGNTSGYTALFAVQHQLTTTAEPADAGTILSSPAHADGYYDRNSTVQLTATAARGWAFSNWSEAAAGSSNPVVVTIDAAKTVTANFVRSGPIPLRFVAMTPCRAVDTRKTAGPFNGPALGASSSRTFALRNSACGVPAAAQAYSLNATVVPLGALGYLTLWPTGQTRPTVSTVAAPDGRIKANAAVVQAGDSGEVSVFASDSTHVVLDINGYFVPETEPGSLSFYPLTPCRAADTRHTPGGLISSGQSRDFVLAGACGIPAGAGAYSVNFTAVPKHGLGFMTAWPTGAERPLASLLNAPTGTIVANAAIVQAGSGGAVSVFASDDTDVVIDVNGYFAAPGEAGALSFYPASPCRAVDTRRPAGEFGGPALSGERDFAVSSTCGVAADAVAYALNATVVPPGGLGYLTLWPWGSTRPGVSTLSALDANITSNAAIVPAASGKITAYSSDPTQLVLDLNGYFAP